MEERPWGRFFVLDKGPVYQVKRLEVDPGKRISYQLHFDRMEFWTIVSGVGKLTLEDQDREVKLGDQVCVMPEAPHRIENTGKTPLVIIEVQMGKRIREDDIVRLSDDYGRAKEGEV